MDRPDIPDGRREAAEASAACSQDALDSMRNDPQRLVRQASFSPTDQTGYPPPLSLDGRGIVDPDNEAWRRSNPFDKHYDPRAAGAASLDRSLSQSYDPQNPGSGDFRMSPYRRTPDNGTFNTDPYRQNTGDYAFADPYRRNQGDNSYADPYRRNQGDNSYADPYRRNQGDNSYADPYRQQNPDGYRRNPDDLSSNPYRRNPEQLDRRDARPGATDSNGNICRDASDRRNFYAHQNDGYSCSAFSMAMMASDWNTGRPPSNAESTQWKRIAGTLGQGYRGSLNQVASNLREGIPDLQTKVYNYGMGKVGTQAMQDLNRELAQGHTAVAKVINPHTGNAHYIYIAGRTNDGQYILGDPDRKNPHQDPISGDRLMRMMSRRDGFVAGWKDSQSMATRSQGSAANRYAMANGRDNSAIA